MELVPSLDLQAARSRLVFWPGAATGAGTPTDRPERIARHFVELGAPLIHLVDLDGAQRGVPANIEAIQRVSRAVAVPLQLAGGVDGPRQIEVAFACGATRVVMPVWSVVESPATLADSLRVAGDWLAVGIDGRPDRLAQYPWRDRPPPTFEELVQRLIGGGVRRLVVSHWEATDVGRLLDVAGASDVDLQLAGGVTNPAALLPLARVGVGAVLVGEALFNGSIDYAAAVSLLRSDATEGTIQ